MTTRSVSPVQRHLDTIEDLDVLLPTATFLGKSWEVIQLNEWGTVPLQSLIQSVFHALYKENVNPEQAVRVSKKIVQLLEESEKIAKRHLNCIEKIFFYWRSSADRKTVRFIQQIAREDFLKNNP